jgi:hypothetical protein
MKRNETYEFGPEKEKTKLKTDILESVISAPNKKPPSNFAHRKNFAFFLYCICTVLYCGPYHLVVSLTRNIRLWPRWLVKSVQVDGWRILVDRERRLSTQRIHMTSCFQFTLQYITVLLYGSPHWQVLESTSVALAFGILALDKARGTEPSLAHFVARAIIVEPRA